MDTKSVSDWSHETNPHHYQAQSLVSSPWTSHWSNGTKQQPHLVVANCHPGDRPLGIHSPEGKTLSNIWRSTFFCPDTNTHSGSLCEPLLSKIKISGVVCLHLKLIGSHLHNDLLAKWPCQLVFSCGAPPPIYLMGLHSGGSMGGIPAETLKHSILTFPSEEQAAAECTKVAWH